MRTKVATLAIAVALAGGAGCGTDPARAEHVDLAQICAALVAEYAAAWPAARACDPDVVGECVALRPAPIRVNGAPAGLGCDGVVNPAHAKGLDAILVQFDAAGCKELPLPCPIPPDLKTLPRRCSLAGSCD
jgi:hypothetical protein